MDEADARREMGEILDELAALPADAFAEKVALRDRQEELRAFLENPDRAEVIKARWAKDAAHKFDPDDRKGSVISPFESGGGGGGVV